MEKVCPWCGQLSDRGRLKNRTEHRAATYTLAACYSFASHFEYRPYGISQRHLGVFVIHRVTVTQFRSVSMPAGFRRHLVGKTLKNAGYCNST